MTMLYLLVLVFALGVAGWLAWMFFGRNGGALFGTSREARIGVTEVASVDGKRRLLLIHRDGVEHLIMTGGPVDVVIEQGIRAERQPAALHAPAAPAAYEPRLAPQMATVEPAGEPQPGFGRLRQRASASPANEPGLQRTDPPSFASGSGGSR